MSITVLEELKSEGFRPRLYWPEPESPEQPTRPAPRLVVDGAEPLPEALREAVRENRDVLKASIILSDPPEWLARLFDLYWSDHDTPVRMTNPATGKAEVNMVHVSIKNICAAAAAEIGMPALEWERIRPEVEECVRGWKTPKKMEELVYD